MQRLVREHAATAARRCPSIRARTRSTPRPAAQLRDDAAAAGVDTAVIALWLGHADIRSTNTYLHADMTIKQRALELTTPVSTPPGRYRPEDAVLAFLESL